MPKPPQDLKSRTPRPTPTSPGPPAADRLRPWLLAALSALFVARPLFPSESAATQGDGLPVVMLWIALLVFWLLGLLGRPRFAVRFGLTNAAVAALIALHTIAAIWAAMHASPRPALNMLWEWIAFGLAFFLARQLIVGRREVRAVVVVMVALAVALSGYGLYQCFYEMPETRAAYAEAPDQTMRDAGLWYPPDSPERSLFESRLASAEPMATFALTNSLAGYLAPWLAMLAGIAIARWPRYTWLKVAVCAVPIAVCLVLTGSRSGCLAAALGLVLVYLLFRQRDNQRKKPSRWGLPAAIAIAGALLLATATAAVVLDARPLAGAATSLRYRMQYWQSTLQMIAEHPLLGCGPGNFQNAYTAYKLPQASEEVADPHNFLLEVWATAGTPVMLALLAVLGCFAWTSWRRRNDSDAAAEQTSRSNPFAGDHPISDSPLHVLGGAGCGFLLAWPLGRLSAAPPGVAAVLLGLPLAAAAAALLAGWIDRGRLPTLLPAIGVLVLLVNLLAAGGIGIPGVAGTFWLLLALGLGSDPPRSLPRPVAWVALAAALAAAVACYSSAYSPVLRSQGKMCLARQQLAHGNVAEAQEYLEAAARSDPLAYDPWQQSASVAFQRWIRSGGDDQFRRFQQHNAMALRRAPNWAPAWLASGDRYLAAFLKTRRRADLQQAIQSYRRAVRCYRNSALYHAKLAVALDAAGDPEAFRREAAAALQLDHQTPHADKKLPADLRAHLLRKGSH